MDEEFRDNRRKRRRLEKKWRKNKSEEDRKEYIEQREVCAELSARKQNEYYTKLVDEAGNDQKSLFKVANHLLDKGKTRVLPEHTDPLQLANRFNKYYINKIDKLRKSILPSNIESQVGRKKFDGVELSVFEPATDEELTKIIKSFGIKTSPEDPIPADVLQSVIDVALPCIRELVNKSLSEGSMECVKSSVIDPLLKNIKLDSDIDKNYRPVNNLVFFSKLIERVVKRRTNGHMTVNALHTDNQFGYKQWHSTETMMLGLSDEVLSGFEKNECTIIVFLDLSAAFDTIDIDKLLDIFEYDMGITGVAL